VAVVSRNDRRLVYQSDLHVPRSAFEKADARTTMLQVRFEEMTRVMTGGQAASVGVLSDPNAGEWDLLLLHRAGSVDRAVAVVRRRNLAVSFGVVLLLAVSLIATFVSTRRAQRLARQQMEFVAGVSHELRTPLSVIRSAGENLSDGLIDEPGQVRRYGALVAAEGRRLTQMVEQVMAFAGFNPDRILADRDEVDLLQLVEAAVSVVVGDEQPFTLERRFEQGLPIVKVNATAMSRRPVMARRASNEPDRGASTWSSWT
jgi:signal transduction histidine kinase